MKKVLMMVLVMIFIAPFISLANETMVICPSKTRVVIRRSNANNEFVKWYCAARVSINNGALEYIPINRSNEIQKPHYLSPAIIWETCHVDDMNECFK